MDIKHNFPLLININSERHYKAVGIKQIIAITPKVQKVPTSVTHHSFKVNDVNVSGFLNLCVYKYPSFCGALHHTLSKLEKILVKCEDYLQILI